MRRARSAATSRRRSLPAPLRSQRRPQAATARRTGRAPPALKTAWVATIGSWNESNGTSQAPSGKPRAMWRPPEAPAWFPAPPRPVRANSRAVASRRLTLRSPGRRPANWSARPQVRRPGLAGSMTHIRAGYAAPGRLRRRPPLPRAGQFGGGLDAGERDQRGLVDRLHGSGVLGKRCCPEGGPLAPNFVHVVGDHGSRGVSRCAGPHADHPDLYGRRCA